MSDEKPMKDVLVIKPSGKPNDYPFADIAEACRQHISEGKDIYQKFSCAKCGTRQGIEIRNVLYETASCELCGHITDIKTQGCNYMLVLRNATLDDVGKILK